MLSSCKQLKSLTAHDPSPARQAYKKANIKEVIFLDNITVTPGQEVKSKHNSGSVGPDTRNAKRKTVERETYDGPAGNIERLDWLQLKYAIVLDATVENLSNLKLLQVIDEWWGTKYCMGGSTKNCVDCSSFTQTVMSDVYSKNLPRTAQEQYNAAQRIEVENLKEGDLVFFHTTGREISHVGIYLLNNKFVHASTSGGVMVSDLNDSYWQPRFKGAGRM